VRVVQVGKYYYPYVGGIESHLFTLVNELKHQVDLDVIVSNTNWRTQRDVHRGVSVTRCGALTHAASTALSPGMVLELSQRDYDVVHLHLPHPVGVASYLASKKPARHRLIVSYHSDVVRQQRLLALYAPLVDRLLTRADVVIATSPNYRESSSVLQRFSAKTTVVPYGIDLEMFRHTEELAARAREIRVRFGDRPLLVAVGRLVYYKGFEFAIRALPQVPDAQLLIIGDGPLRIPLEQLARELGVRDRVHLLGEMQNHETPAYYFASDLYLLPSIARSEAFGIVQIEAMACGLPVINTELPSGVPFVSRHGESGLTVPPSDAVALSGAIRELLAQPQTRKNMGAAGRARAEREFSKQALAAQMLAIYAGRPASAAGAERVIR
jgi:glycosyltransferase involved in cell wall biosynthesis